MQENISCFGVCSWGAAAQARVPSITPSPAECPISPLTLMLSQMSWQVHFGSLWGTALTSLELNLYIHMVRRAAAWGCAEQRLRTGRLIRFALQ